MAAFKVIVIDKNMFNVGIKVSTIASIDVILMFLVKYLDMILGNDLKIKKQWPVVFLKLSLKLQKNICVFKRDLPVSFRKVSDFNYVDNCFTYICFKFLGNLDRAVF